MQLWTRTYDLDDRRWDDGLPDADSPATLVIAFGSPEHPSLRDGLASLVGRYAKSVVVGCSSAGEIAGATVRDASLSVAVARFEHTRLSVAAVEVTDASGSHAAGRELASKLAGADLRAVFVLSDGLGVNGSELVRGINEGLPSDVVVTGGLSGDGTRFQRTWVLDGGEARPRRVVAVGLYGARLRVGHGSQGGWDQFGPERTITRSEGNVLFELDGRPALDLYKQYLGEKASELPSSGLLFPLALRNPDDPDKVLVRTLLAVDEAAKSMTFAGDLPTGHTVQLMKANFDRLVAGASGAAEAASPAVDDDGPTLAVAVSCVGRRLVLGERIDEEVEAIQQSLGERASIVGFYSYGELSPYGLGSCDLHNQTMTLTTFSEAADAVGLPAPSAARGGMDLARLQYRAKRGTWDAPLPVHLDSPRTLVTLFGSSNLDDLASVTKKVRVAFPRAQVIGCSSAGEIHGTSVQDGTISMSVARFGRTRLQGAHARVERAEDSRRVGERLGRELAAPDLRAVFVLSDGLGVNGSELVAGLNGVLGQGVLVTGGLAGDGTRFQKTWVLAGSELGSGLVAAVGFYGDHVVVNHGSLGGWDPFGPERTVTKSKGNVLFELDGRPALDLYKQYLGDKASELPASGLLFPLALRAPSAPDTTLVRTLLAVDEAAKSMTFAGDLPEGSTVQLMKADFDRLVAGAEGAAEAARFDVDVLNGSASLAIAVSCVGRRLVLGERIDEEVEAIARALPTVDHITGFYSYGELSPAVDSPTCDLHNQTMTLTTIAESPEPVRREVDTRVAGASLALSTGTWSQPLPRDLDGKNTLVLVFGASEAASHPALGAVARAFPRSVVVGCSTSGEIHGTRVQDGTLSVSVMRFARTRLRAAQRSVRSGAESYGAGQQLARELAAPDLRAVFVLSEGLGVNGSELVRGINAALPEQVVVTGGLSGDGTRFGKTWVLADGKASSGVIAAVGFYGDHVVVGHGSRGGWDRFGPERTVTRSEGNVLYEIDGSPALALYKGYLGELASELPASGLRFPLAIRRPGEDKLLVRTLLAVDEAKNSLTFAGDVPQGYTVQLMKANFDRLVSGAEQAAGQARSDLAGPTLAVAVSCVGRRLVLGERIEDEVEALRATLGPDAHISGFYSYGELSPTDDDPACDLHNQTMTLTTFAESATPARYGRQGGLTLGSASWQKGAWDRPLPAHLDGPRTLVTVFGAPEIFDAPEPMMEVRRAFPRSVLVGCSSAGEIHGTDVRDGSLSVCVSRFAKTDLRAVDAVVASGAESRAVGDRLARELAASDLRAVFVLSDGLGVNGSELIAGFNEVLGSDVVVTGGLSGDGTRFQRTWVLTRDRLQTGLVAAVGMYGDHVVVRHGSLGGWDAFGPERTVTRSAGNVLFELDGRPALDLYKQYLGDKAAELPASGLLFPLALRSADAPGKVLVRTLLAVDEGAKSMTFAGDLPEGSTVQLMKADFERLVDGAEGAARVAALRDEPAPGSASLAIAISCVGRRLVLGDRIEEEVEAVRRALPDVDQITGFYSYGELSPAVDSPTCDLHNQTMTLTTLAESAEPIARARGLVVRAVQHRLGAGWSAPLPTDLDSERTAVLVFGSPKYAGDHEALRDVARAFPRSRILGCSSAGEIHGTDVGDDSLSVTVARFRHTELRLASTPCDDPTASRRAGELLASRLAGPDLRAVFVLSEGLKVNGSELVAGMNVVLGRGVKVTGGLSGDGTRFQTTWVTRGGPAEPGQVVALGFYGDHVMVGHGSRGGWDPFGPERTITRSTGNVLFELDGRPALALYKQYLGDLAAELPASGLRFPLSVWSPEAPDRVLVRTLLAVDEAAGSMTFAGDVPTGWRAQLMKADFERLVGGSRSAAQQVAMPRHDGGFAVAVSCVGRRLVLGDGIEAEVEAIRDTLPDLAHITGFYSYGELAPLQDGPCDLHNQTMTLSVFAESATPLARPAIPDEDTQVLTNVGLPRVDEAKRRPAAQATPAPAPAPAPAAPAPQPIAQREPPPDPPTERADERKSAAPAEDVHFAFDAFEAPVPTGQITAPPVERQSQPPRAAEPPAAPTRRPTVQRAQMPTELHLETRRADQFTVVTLAGRVSEGFKGAELGRQLMGNVIFDLYKVERITSFGIREWLDMIREMDADELYFARCSEAVVNQITMIRNFCGHGQIVSFFAPYACSACGNEFSALYDAVDDAATIRAHNPVPVGCPRCGSEASLDDDPWSYFSLGAQLVPAKSAALVQVIERLAPMGDAAEPVEKTIEGTRTTVKVNARLDGNLRLRRVFDGLEGAVVFDLSAVPAATEEGAAAFARALRRLEPEVSQAHVAGCPQVLLELLVNGPPVPRLQIDSCTVEARCAEPPGRRTVLVDLEEHRAAIEANRDPRIACDWCAGEVTFDEVRSLLRSALDTRAPAPPTAPGQAADVAPPVSRPAAASPVPAPVAPVALPVAAGADRGLLLGGAMGLAGLGVAVVLTGLLIATAVVWMGSQPPPPAAAPAPAPVAAEPAPPARQLGWEGGGSLAPAWTEVEFVKSSDRVLVVGSARGADPEAALQDARKVALARLISGLQDELRGTRVHDFLVRAGAGSDPSRQAAAADRYLKQVGEFATPTRTEVAIRHDATDDLVFAQYSVSAETWSRLVDHYGASASFRGIRVAPVFPSLAGSVPDRSDLLVVETAAWMREANLGDLVVKVGDRGVWSVADFSEQTETQWARTKPGGRLEITVHANGIDRVLAFTKPEETPR